MNKLDFQRAQVETTQNLLDAVRSRMRLAFCALLLLGFQSAYGERTTITPRIFLTETFTDNLELLDDDKKSDFVTELTPGISASLNGSRVKGNIDYQLQGLLYASESDNNGTNHQLDSNANVEVFREAFLVDADAAVFQSLIDTNSTVALDNVNTNNNRADVVTANISPYLQHRFGNSVEALARYRYGIVNYSKSDKTAVGSSQSLVDSTIQSASLSIGDMREISRKWNWQLAANYLQDDFDNGKVDKFRSALASIGYWITGKVQFLVDGGVDDNDFESEGLAGTSGTFWVASLYWDPSSRNHFEAGFGRRYSGDLLNFLWSRNSRFVTSSISYHESLDTNSNVTALDGGNQDAGNINLFDSNATVFKRKLFSATTLFQWSKNTFELAFSNERREKNAPSKDDKVTSLNADWEWRFSGRTSMEVLLSAYRWESGDSNEDNELGRASLGFTRRLGKKTSVNLKYTHSRQESDDNVNEYRENRVSLSLARDF